MLKPRYTPFVGGRFLLPSKLDRDIPVINPATGLQLCTVESASSEAVSSAIRLAHDTFQSGIWSQASPHDRSVVLSRLARDLERSISTFSTLETLQTGRTIREMRTQLGRLPEWLCALCLLCILVATFLYVHSDYYAALLRTRQAFVAPTRGKLLNYVYRVPLGVVAQITPFNHPLLIAIKKLAPALAAGNSVIIKPSELAPVSVLQFAFLAKEAGVPDGVLSVLPGNGHSTGEQIVSNPLIKKVDITAGTETGRHLGATVGRNLAYFTAELGGKAPLMIFDDADLECAVNGAAFAAFVASGQTCVSATRLIVQESIYDIFQKAFVKKVESIDRRMGNPMNPLSSMGTVISSRHLERIQGMINRSSGNILLGGVQKTGRSLLDGFDFSNGSFFSPTIITDVGMQDELWTEEVFGPVVVLERFATEEEGVFKANNCKYGLGAGIWTTDLSRAHRVAEAMEAGVLWVNTHHRNDPSSPWGGMKDSGIGRENGLEAFDSYTQSKSVIINIAHSAESLVQDDWFAEDGQSKRYG